MKLTDKYTWTIWFDHLLDDLPRSSAPFLRLERFWNWSWHYDRKFYCLIQDRCDVGGALLSEVEKWKASNALTNHFLARRAFNPMSFKHVQEEKNEATGHDMFEESPENK
jgi:hypothetical protein